MEEIARTHLQKPSSGPGKCSWCPTHVSQIKPAILACPRASLISLCLTSQLYHIKLVTWFSIKEITSACPGRILEKPTMLNAILSPCIHLGIYRFFFHCYFNMTLYKALHNLPLASLPLWSLPHPTRWLHSCHYTGLFVVPWTPEVCPQQVFHTDLPLPQVLFFFLQRYVRLSDSHSSLCSRITFSWERALSWPSM